MQYPSTYIFEHDYVTNVLGIDIPLHESKQMSSAFKQQVIAEHRLLREFFFGAKSFKSLSKMGNDFKNAGLTLRYIIEDPSRIDAFVGELLTELEKKIKAIFSWVKNIQDAAKKLGEAFIKKVSKFLEMVKSIKDSLDGVVDKIKGLSGWKQALLALSSLVAVSYVRKNVRKFGGHVTKALGTLVGEFLPEESGLLGALKDSSEEISEWKKSSMPLLVTAVYSNEPIEEIFGWGKKKKKDKKGKKKKSGKTSVEKGDKARDQKAKKADDALEKGKEAKEMLPEEAYKSSAWKEFGTAIKNMLKQVGGQLLKSLAIDALVGSLSGGIGVAFNYLRKAFGGIKFVIKVMSKPLQKFSGKIKDAKSELKDAEEGIDDPTAPDNKKKNEAYIRQTVRNILLDSL